MSYNIIYLLIIVLIISYYFFIMQKSKEGFTNDNNTHSNMRCPNLLVQKGSEIFLYNTKLNTVPGVNPLRFKNLEEYKDFIKWQRSNGIFCPVLYLKQEYNTQGERIYKLRPDINEPQCGLPQINVNSLSKIPINDKQFTLLTDSGRNDKPYNSGSLPSFDPKNQDIGKITPQDFLNQSNNFAQDNAMDPQWNPEQSQRDINNGKFEDNNVSIYIS